MACESLATKSDIQNVIGILNQILAAIEGLKCEVDLNPVINAVKSAEENINSNVNYTRGFVSGAVYDVGGSILSAINALDFDCVCPPINIPPIEVPPCDLNPVINAIKGAENNINSNVNYTRGFVAGAVYDAELAILNAINGIDCAEDITTITNTFNDFSQTFNDFSSTLTNNFNDFSVAFSSSLTNTFNYFSDTVTNTFNEYKDTLNYFNDYITNNFNDFSSTLTNNFNDFSSTLTNNFTNNFNDFSSILTNNFNDFGVSISNAFYATYQNIDNQYSTITNNLGNIIYDNSQIINNISNIETKIENITTQIETTNNTTILTIEEKFDFQGVTWNIGKCDEPDKEGDWYSYKPDFSSGNIPDLAQMFIYLNQQLEKIHADVCKSVQYKLPEFEKPLPLECVQNEDGEMVVQQMSIEAAAALPWWGILIGEGVSGWAIGKILDTIWESLFENQKQTLQALCAMDRECPEVLLPDPRSVIYNVGKYLIITWVEITSKSTTVYNSQIQIAEPIPDLWNGTQEELEAKGNWKKYFADITWITGNQYARFYCEQREEPLMKGWFKDTAEADKIFAWGSTLSILTPLQFRNPKYPQVANNTVYVESRVRVVHKAKIIEKSAFSEETKELVCYRRKQEMLIG